MCLESNKFMLVVLHYAEENKDSTLFSAAINKLPFEKREILFKALGTIRKRICTSAKDLDQLVMQGNLTKGTSKGCYNVVVDREYNILFCGIPFGFGSKTFRELKQQIINLVSEGDPGSNNQLEEARTLAYNCGYLLDTSGDLVRDYLVSNLKQVIKNYENNLKNKVD